jgi:hypothetical protein
MAKRPNATRSQWLQLAGKPAFLVVDIDAFRNGKHLIFLVFSSMKSITLRRFKPALHRTVTTSVARSLVRVQNRSNPAPTYRMETRCNTIVAAGRCAAPLAWIF